MSTIISVHSYRGGPGKSNLVANLASSLAQVGKRVAMIDTHPVLNEETLLSIIVSDIMILILRPDQQDFQGTAVTVEVARMLKLKHLLLVVNKVLPKMDSVSLRKQVQSIYNAPVAALLPVSEAMMELGSAGIFNLVYPDHLYSKGVREIVAQIMNPAEYAE
jgi:MinD-like ATPase involved in chromosome partitioning or flagellar assembly